MINCTQSSTQLAICSLTALLVLAGCTNVQPPATQLDNYQPIDMPQTLYADEARRYFVNQDEDGLHLRHPEPANALTIEAIVTAAKWPFFDSFSVWGERKVQFEIKTASHRLSYQVGDRILLRNTEGGRTQSFFVPNGHYGGQYLLVFESDGRLYGVRNMRGEYYESEPASTTSTQPLLLDTVDETTRTRQAAWVKICEKLTDIVHLMGDIIEATDSDFDSYFWRANDN